MGMVRLVALTVSFVLIFPSAMACDDKAEIRANLVAYLDKMTMQRITEELALEFYKLDKEESLRRDLLYEFRRNPKTWELADYQELRIKAIQNDKLRVIEEAKSLSNLWELWHMSHKDWNVRQFQKDCYLISGYGLGLYVDKPCVGSWHYYKRHEEFLPADLYAQELLGKIQKK